LRFQASRTPAEAAGWIKTTGPLLNARERYNAAPTQALLTAGISRTNQVLFSTELVAFFGAVEWHDSILTPMRPIEFVL